MKTIAIIPARSGSKGLKDKNIKKINGKPLLAYSIEAAIESKIFDVVMVSTDSEKYAHIAAEYGAEVPFLRSSKTASDEATTRDCILEVLNAYEKLGKTFDRFMILQPTSPLRTAQNIIDADVIYNEKHAKSVVGVCEVDHSPLWCNTIDDNLSMDKFIEIKNVQRRQALKIFYRINGAIYLHDTEYYRENEFFYDQYSFACLMKKEESIDIDDELDFKIAEVFINNK